MKYANHHGYTDINPFEVIREISDKTLEVRKMDAIKDESVKLEFIPGGFCAHCKNQREQKWFISPNESGKVFRIRLGKLGWKDAEGRRFILSDKPIKFYDYNF